MEEDLKGQGSRHAVAEACIRLEGPEGSRSQLEVVVQMEDQSQREEVEEKNKMACSLDCTRYCALKVVQEEVQSRLG